MSRNRRDTASQRSMGDFVTRAGSGNRVEIIDDEDDEVEEINTQEVMESNPSSRSPLLRPRRQRREAEQEPLFSDEEEPNDEWRQTLQQVLIMSKIEADKQEERRKMCGTMQDVMNLQVKIEPLKSNTSKSVATETARKTTGDKQEDQREGAESPDLFVTPPEDQEQLSDKAAANNIESDPEFANSPPLPVTMRSPDPNGKGAKETNSPQAASAGPSFSQDKGDSRRKFNLRRSKREAADLSSQKENKLEESNLSDSEARDQVIQSGSSKNDDVNPGEKRKLKEDDGDVTDDEDEEPLVGLKRKRSLKRKKPWVSLENSDSDNTQEVDKKCSKRSQDGLHDPSPKRIAVTLSDTDEKAKRNGKEPSAETRQIRTPTSMIRLTRRYKKTRRRPTNLKEAMKANIYFAPPGFDLPAYTTVIIRMFEKFRRQLYVAQSKVKTRIPWGPPVVPGIRDTLELKQPRRSTASMATRASIFVRNSPHGATDTDTKSQSEFDISDRRRSLRSSSNPVKQATASTSTSKSPSATVPPYKVDSDSDDGDWMKSYLDEMARPSVSSSTKKPVPSLSRNRGRSNKRLTEDRVSGKTEATGEPGTQTKSRSDGVSSNVEVEDRRREVTKEPVVGDQGSLDDAKVVSDPESREIQSNTVGSSAGTLKTDSKITANSGTGQTKLDNENSSSESRVLPERKTTDNDVSLMDTDQDSQAEIIRPRKRRSVLQPAIIDDSTDDESDLSQPMFSMRFPVKEASVNSEVPDSRDDAGNRDQDPLAGQSLSPRSGSQGMVGKSILDKMAAAGEELLPSQTLLESDLTTNKQLEETKEERSFDVAGTSSSAASSSINQARQGLADEEKEVVDVDSSGSERVRQMRSAAAEKAAAAAEKRHKMASRRNLKEACPSSSLDDRFSTSEPKDAEAEVYESTVECPLCYEHFDPKEIEAHASDCQGPPPQASYCSQTQSEETGARSEPGPSIRSVPARADTNPLPSVYRTLTGERGELKHLRVVLQSSPIAKQKLLQKATQQRDSAKRSLAFDKDSRPSGSLDQCHSSRSSDQDSRKPSRNTRAALRTESESEESGYVREKEESSSTEVYSWLDASSPERKKPKHTYGSSGGGNAPKLGGDYIPLNVEVESDEDDATEEASKEQVPRKTFSRRTEEVESGSDTSDDSLMMQYGAQRVSPRRKGPKQVKTDEMDENEIALELLGGRSKKRPLSLSRGSKPKKSRRPRDSDSQSESDESSIVCQLCEKKIPKELYKQHVDEELETRKLAKRNVSRKAEVVTMKDRRQGSLKDEQRRSSPRVQAQKNVPCTSTATEETENDDVDWDGVSDSPIKCFQFTENSSSVVDFENQFEHLKETRSGSRRSNYGQNDGSSRGNRGGYRGFGARGGNRGSGNRGNYRGSYMKVYGRGKKYGKYRGSRARK